ncbi:MAG: hypothetical protein ACI8QC_000077 [Planctomycetota bacterium]|jgi:hypothetical protein
MRCLMRCLRSCLLSLGTVLLLLNNALGQDPASMSVEARSEGRYADALAFAERVEDPGAQALLALLAHYWAGDLSGALAAGRRGLEEAPGHLELLYYCSLLPLDLAVPELAAEILPRLNRVVLESKSLAADDRATYMQLCEALAQRLEDQQVGELQRNAAVTRGKGLALLLGCAMVLATLGMLVPRSRRTS